MDSARLSQLQEGTTYSLVLRNVAQHDAGVYTCLARNAGGQVLCKAELLVHGGESGPSQAPLLAPRKLPWARAQDTMQLGQGPGVVFVHTDGSRSLTRG